MAEPAVHAGFHAVFELLKSNDTLDGTVVVAGQNVKARDAVKLANERGVRVEEVDQRELERRAGAGVRHIAFIGHVRRGGSPKSVRHFVNALEGDTALVLLLDGISDPQNYGAILRTACQFSVDLVVVPHRRSAPDSAAVSRASAGALAMMDVVREANLPAAIEQLQEARFWVYGADMKGVDARQERFGGRTALVVGSEGEGLAPRVRSACDRLIAVPTTGPLDSLNVSVSTGILLYEMRR
jgi:23S rRNA (guanosine2251-2'-O)-methyltransferase